MDKEEKRKYIFAQLRSLPNATQYVEVAKYIQDLEEQIETQQEVINKIYKKCNSKTNGDMSVKLNDGWHPLILKENILNILKEEYNNEKQ